MGNLLQLQQHLREGPMADDLLGLILDLDLVAKVDIFRFQAGLSGLYLPQGILNLLVGSFPLKGIQKTSHKRRSRWVRFSGQVLLTR